MTLGEAWSLWWAGPVGDERLLWGIELFWWARLGKLLQLVAGAAILAEIIGAEQLRAFGNTLHRGFTINSSLTYMRNCWSWYKAMTRFVFSKPGSPEEKSAMEETDGYGADNINFLLSLLSIVPWTILLHNLDLAWPFAFAISLFLALITLVIFGPLITVFLIFAALLAGSIIDVLILEPIAWALERPALDKWIKAMSLVLLLIGFHFDFLDA